MEQDEGAGPAPNPQPVSRREFLAGGAAVAAGAVALRGGNLSRLVGGPLRSLSRRSAGSSATVTFWDMEWGASAYSTEGAALVSQYNKLNPKNPPVSYQAVTWTGWYEKFASAIASHTNPDCSSGAGYQAFQFSQAGAIQPLDALVAQMTKDGIAADFQPGTLDVLKYKGHYVAIPWEIDIRVLYYRKSVLGPDVPATWDDLLTVGKALKKKGIYVLNSAGNASFNGWQFLPIMFMLGNGGGFFNAKGEPDATSDANVEAVEFILQLAKDKYLDPASISFDQTAFQSAFGSGKAAMSVGTPKWTVNFSPNVAADTVVASPLKSPSGKTGTIFWVNNLMAYKGSYDLQGMYDWYIGYSTLMKAYWQKGLVGGLPVRKSFGQLPEVANNPTLSVPLKEWLPVAKTTAAAGTSLSPGLNALEGSTALPLFTQQLIQGSQSAKTILSALQTGVEQAMK
ncbi:MAG TPA: extracellular solute-binding protein [Acidimicrobiales bacterium]|nr:extracellular solute-binding protein [Acidimicrobiales bacterium]